MGAIRLSKRAAVYVSLESVLDGFRTGYSNVKNPPLLRFARPYCNDDAASLPGFGAATPRHRRQHQSAVGRTTQSFWAPVPDSQIVPQGKLW